MVKLIDDYKRYYDEYSAKFAQVAILLQCGGFFECYCNPSDPILHAVVSNIAGIINCELTVKDPRSDDGTLMGGFPLRSLEKNINKLVENDYTVVVVEQLGNVIAEGEDRVPRQVTRVVSKGTVLDHSRLRNNVMSIYYRKYAKGTYSFGVSVIDTSISKHVIVHDIHSKSDDKGFALDTAIRLVCQYSPVECIIVTQWGESADEVAKLLGITCSINKRDVQMISEEVKQTVGEHHLSEVISLSLGSLYTWLDEHKMSWQELQVNSFKNESYLDLCSNAVKQLDIYSVINRREIFKPVTSMGKRLITERMLTPTKDINELERRYDAIDALNEKSANAMKKSLMGIPDLDKTHQKLAAGKLTWGQFRVWYTCLIKIRDVVGTLSGFQNSDRLYVLRLLQEIDSIVKVDNESTLLEIDEEDKDEDGDNDYLDTKGNDKNQFCQFKKGVYLDLDKMVEDISASEQFISMFIQKAVNALSSSAAKGTNNKVKTFKIKDRTGLVTTHLRAESLKKKLRGLQILKIGNSSIIYTEELRDNLVMNAEMKENIDKLVSFYFPKFQMSLWDKWSTVLNKIARQLAEMDVQQTSYFMKTQFKLVRPMIDQSAKTSYVDIKNLRHLLIELINPSVKYVPNDCVLKYDEESKVETGQNNQHSGGILLYGVNSCGKTSFLKSTGLAIVLAQAGFFVPAESMKFFPFSRIMTRIAGVDNMERSQSSYIVELEELLSIVKRSDNETLVLGDEMCRGTEVESANAMVFTMLKWLVERKCPFIAATHLHDIVTPVQRQLTEKISIYHMKVSLDNEGNVFYERKLHPGPGPTLYGLEIAMAMNFPDKFMTFAYEYRRECMKEEKKEATLVNNTPFSTIAGTKMVKSRYNARKILIKCESCGYKPTDEYSLPLDTHHIEFQCNADAEGFHGTQKKNVLHNLICLCKPCHTRVHQGTLVIKSVQTLTGTKFEITSKMTVPKQEELEVCQTFQTLN